MNEKESKYLVFYPQRENIFKNRKNKDIINKQKLRDSFKLYNKKYKKKSLRQKELIPK